MRFLRHLRFFDLAPQLSDGGLLLTLLTQFALDSFELFTQQIFALHLAHLFLRTGLNFFAQLKDFQFMCQESA